MSKTTAIAVAVIAAVAICALGLLTGVISLNVGGKPGAGGYANKGVLEVICDVEISRPDETLAPPFEVVTLTLPAIFNFDENTAAYPGEYTISMNRKGTLRVSDALLEIHRPSMFKRHGVVIIGEHVTLNRKTGEFRQWLDLEGGKRLDLISGTCKRTDNAPF
ncbi:MAG: hypothetical protein NBV65_06940 [Burkholderiaceae bacterium]|jgi:hypothetical protein|nr:hypothetical protein [Burkholderiaceae bacterium]